MHFEVRKKVHSKFTVFNQNNMNFEIFTNPTTRGKVSSFSILINIL